MKVTVFGGAGFLGSHVADILSEQGHKVRIFDKVASPYLRGDQEMTIGDVLDEKAVRRAVEGSDVVYNFIAVADLDEADIAPVKTTSVNVLGNVIILDAAKQAKVKRFIFSSSVYVYSDTGSFYRCSKQACEIFIENYQKAYGLNYTILRYGSLYGPRSDEKNFIYRMLKQAILEKKIRREGDGEEIREYIHVLDAARLTVDILKDNFVNRSVIITGREQIKIKDLLKMVREILKNEVEIEFLNYPSKMHYEITPYVFNPKLALKIHSNEHIDMGQGILNILDEIYTHHSKPATSPIIIPKDSSISQSYA